MTPAYAGAPRGDRHRGGRPPRHRQEPGRDDVEGRRHRGHRPWRQRVCRTVRGSRARARRPPRRRVRAPHHDDAQHAGLSSRRFRPPASPPWWSSGAPPPPRSSPTRSVPTDTPRTQAPRSTWFAACWPLRLAARASAGRGGRPYQRGRTAGCRRPLAHCRCRPARPACPRLGRAPGGRQDRARLHAAAHICGPAAWGPGS